MTIHSFKIENWTIEPTLNRISSEDVEIVLVPKVMKLLRVLATHPNQVLSQDQLINKVWEGNSVSDSSLYQAVAKLRKALGDDASNPRYIERISGQGYRLIATVSMHSHTTDNADQKVFNNLDLSNSRTDSANISPTKSRKYFRAGLSVILLMVFAGLIYWGTSQFIPSEQPITGLEASSEMNSEMNSKLSPSLSINNFQSITLIDLEIQDDDLPAAVSALNDVLLTRLSHIDGLTLVHLKHERPAISTQAIIRGRISQQSDQIRVFLQIEDVANNEVIWAKFYQGETNDLFSLQDRIVENLVQLFELEKQHKPLFEQQVDSLEFQKYMTARNLWEQRNSRSLLEAKAIYEAMDEAGKLFPLAAIGLCDTYQYLHFYSDWTLDEVIHYCEPLLTNVLKQQPNFGEALAARGLLLSLQKKYILAQESILNAIKFSPNYALSYLWFGNMLREQGQYSKALAMIQKAYELSPMSSQINRSLAYAYLNLRKVTNAKHYYQRSLELDNRFPHKAIADLDFYELDISRAKAFLKWVETNQRILSKSPNYRLTEAQVRLSLGQIDRVINILSELDDRNINPSFLLYMQASLASVQGEHEKVVSLLRERLLIHQNNERFVLPYVLALFQNQQYQDALVMLEKHLPELTDSNIEITFDNQFALSIYLQTLDKLNQSSATKQVTQRLSRWFVEQPQRPSLWLANWLNFTGEKAKARTLLTKLLKQGWLPDFNSEVFPLNTMKKLFIESGLGEQVFYQWLAVNRQLVLDGMNDQ